MTKIQSLTGRRRTRGRRTLAFILILLGIVLPITAQDVLRNSDVLKMVESGLGTDLILTMIRESKTDFSTDLDSVLTLKKAGVPDEVIQAMVEASSDKPRLERPAVVEADTNPEGIHPTEVGVYYVDQNGQLALIEPEVVTWKTGGFWKSVATAGLNKGHINGIVRNATTSYKLNGTEELYIYCTEGTSATEYQLLRLWEKKDQRSFRAVTGGIVHSSGGADENLVYFEPVRVAPRLYKFRLPSLAPGEFGLLPPGAISSSSAASIGKIHSFTVAR